MVRLHNINLYTTDGVNLEEPSDEHMKGELIQIQKIKAIAAGMHTVLKRIKSNLSLELSGVFRKPVCNAALIQYVVQAKGDKDIGYEDLINCFDIFLDNETRQGDGDINMLLVNEPLIGGPSFFGGFDGDKKIVISTDYTRIFVARDTKTTETLDSLKIIGINQLGRLFGLKCRSDKLCMMKDIIPPNISGVDSTREVLISTLLGKFRQMGMDGKYHETPIICRDCAAQMIDGIKNPNKHPILFQHEPEDQDKK